MFLQPSPNDIPVDLSALFGRRAPVVGEIGVGSGYFLAHMASARTDLNFIGVETHSASVRRTYHRVREAGLASVRLYHGEGRFFLRNLLPERALEQLYINFPDPWPKEKHASKRLTDRSFFRAASSRLTDNGTVYLTTDHEEYLRWAIRQARASTCFRALEKTPPPHVLESRYARKWRAEHRTIYHAEFHKTSHASVTPTLEIVPMQHAVLEGALPDLTTFEPIVHAFDENHVVIKRVLRPLDGEAAYFAVHLEEEGLTQDVLLRVRFGGEENRVLVGVDPFGRPIATRGVAESVHVLTEWFAEQGLTVVDRSY